LTEEDFKKKREIEKQKQRDERKEAGRRQKRGCKRNAKEGASGNIQTQNRVYEMEGVDNPLCTFCNTDLSVDHIQWECKETEDQRTNMDMNKEHWINENKGMQKMMDYAKEIGPQETPSIRAVTL
jgi:hypothetical protein